MGDYFCYDAFVWEKSSSRIMPVFAGGIRRVWMTGSIGGECHMEGLPGSSIVQLGSFICFSWANKISPSSGRNLFPSASVTQTSLSVVELTLTLRVVHLLAFPFQCMWCQQRAVSRLEGKGKQPCCCVLKDDVCTPQEKASLLKLLIPAPSSTIRALLLTTAAAFKHFFPVPFKGKNKW